MSLDDFHRLWSIPVVPKSCAAVVTTTCKGELLVRIEINVSNLKFVSHWNTPCLLHTPHIKTRHGCSSNYWKLIPIQVWIPFPTVETRSCHHLMTLLYLRHSIPFYIQVNCNSKKNYPWRSFIQAPSENATIQHCGEKTFTRWMPVQSMTFFVVQGFTFWS